MKNKKNIALYLAIIVLLITTATFFVNKNKSTKNNDSIDDTESSLFCAKEGETIGASDMPNSCCSGLKPLGGLPNGYDGDCTKPQPPTGLNICASCGDGICNGNFEGKCNCPEDCANSVCGKEGETLGGNIDRCCSGLKPKALSEFGGLFECAK
ncbi:MAG: hypothetical protein M0P97_03560 [Candidatus Moranbacteria bacterium]|nr:hypothetical protein [Candidatus Moranbacteria bacterium]